MAAIAPLLQERTVKKNKYLIASTSLSIADMVKDVLKELIREGEIIIVQSDEELRERLEVFSPWLCLIEANFCQIILPYMISEWMSYTKDLRFGIFHFEPLSKHEAGRFYNLGARAVINFRKGSDYCKQAILLLLRDREFITPEIESILKDYRMGCISDATFTIREIQIMRCAARAWSTEDIAEYLKLSVSWVKNLRSRIYEKAGIRNNNELLLFAVNMGYVTVEELLCERKGAKKGIEEPVPKLG
jgi:DNA-binding CsgD family transcriptional regulator